MNSMISSDGPKSGFFGFFALRQPLPIADEDYAKEFPLPEPHEHSTCKCGEKYNSEQFLALSLPQGSTGKWYYPSSEVTLAIRACACGKRLARRVV